MSGNINIIQYDHKSFRFSPYTVHSHVPDSGIMLYDDASVPDRQGNALKLDNKFNATAVNTSDSAILSVSLSESQNIDFKVGEQTVSVSAYEYLSGYDEYIMNAPQEMQESFESDPFVFADYERKWSIAFFKNKLSDIIDGPDEFFFELYSGLDNAMGDIGRMKVHSMGNPDDTSCDL